ncbi:1697_t:CDS:2, partial [Ambispora leptoticha]
EMALWRKTNNPDLEEESLKKTVPEEIEARIPADLEDRLNKVNKQLNESIEHYRSMCNIMERLARRHEANGLAEVSSHIQRASTIIEEEANSTIENVLENLKSHRDLLVSFRETFERRNRLAMDDTIDALETRISTNTAKLSDKGDPETERLSAVIQKDQVDVDLQRRRKIFIRHCFNAELSLLHKSSAFVSLLYQNFAHEQIKYSQQLYENWKLLSPKVFEMPIQIIDFG